MEVQFLGSYWAPGGFRDVTGSLKGFRNFSEDVQGISEDFHGDSKALQGFQGISRDIIRDFREVSGDCRVFDARCGMVGSRGHGG